jgi:hypothetical protein
MDLTKDDEEAAPPMVFTTFGEGHLLRVRPDGIHIVKFHWGTCYMQHDCIEGRMDASDEEEDELSSSEDDVNFDANAPDLGSITITGDYELDRETVVELMRPKETEEDELLYTANELHGKLLPAPELAPTLEANSEVVVAGEIMSIVELMVVIQGAPGEALEIGTPLYLEDRCAATQQPQSTYTYRHTHRQTHRHHPPPPPLRSPLGRIDDIFGAVGEPMYTVRMATKADIDMDKLQEGAAL